MSSRAFAAWSAAALVVVLTSTNPVYRVLVLLVALNVLLALRRPDASLRALFIAVGVAAVLATLLNAVLSVEDGYVRGLFREARDEHGQLVHLDLAEEQRILAALPLVELEDGEDSLYTSDPDVSRERVT